MPESIKKLVAVLLALPFGWALGALVAMAIAGPDFGQLPAVTVGLGILTSILFALWPSVPVDTRLRVLFFGTIAFIVLARMV